MTDQFPSLIKSAAETFTNETTAFAQIRIEKGVFKARLQAVEIMQQFVGDVTFGQDPKGILFYKHVFDFEVSQVDFTYQKYSGPGSLVAIKIDFKDKGSTRAFATFISRVDTSKYSIPLNASAGGVGRWTRFKAATAQVDAIRQHDATRLYLQLPPIGREVYFETNKRSSLKSSGILIFRDITKLTDRPLAPEGDDRQLLADYAPDRIVFSLKQKVPTERPKEFALFLPVDPLRDVGTVGVTQPATYWRPFEPDHGFAAFSLASPEEPEEAEQA